MSRINLTSTKAIFKCGEIVRQGQSSLIVALEIILIYESDTHMMPSPFRGFPLTMFQRFDNAQSRG